MSVSYGCDYSMTCPAVVRWDGTTADFCYVHTTKHSYSLPHVTSVALPEHLSFLQRADYLAKVFLEFIRQHPRSDVKNIVFEGYAYAATGAVFHIGENTGIAKYVFMSHEYLVSDAPPTVIKKFATGKGNADKRAMTKAFLAAYPDAQSWIRTFFPRYQDGNDFAKSPLSDLADAYWIARWAFAQPTDK